MNRFLTVFGLATLLTASMARAGDDCAVPMTDWQPRSAVAAMATAQGWTIRRIRIGGVPMGKLANAEWRYLADKEKF